MIAAMEARMVKDAWRTRPRGATAYLELLAANGYERRTSRRRSPRTSSQLT
ncbi:hypothetical protein GS944_13185 [Rhodococcus hoagii]|nr:hypothetical protein [Prescottella equi]